MPLLPVREKTLLLKMSKVFILIGCEGSGKTFCAKTICKGVHPGALFVFDVNNEWQKEYPYPFDRNMDNFLDKVDRSERSVSVYEDATSFFSRRGRDERLIQIVTARRHTKNTFIFLFHAFADVPDYILRKATDVIIFRTYDSPQWMYDNYKKNPVFLEAWQKVQDKCIGHKFWSSYPPPRGVVPPSIYLKR